MAAPYVRLHVHLIKLWLTVNFKCVNIRCLTLLYVEKKSLV